jgi:hypothetical protein
MENPYKKDELTKEEQDFLDTAQQILVDGNILYGIDVDDISHIEWAVGLVVASLKKLQDNNSIATMIEIGKDESGFFVAFSLNAEEASDILQ